jgi:hypothetical protein
MIPDSRVAGFRRLDLAVGRDSSGNPIEESPHERFVGGATHRLHKHGIGPFCRIRVSDAPSAEGVYLVTVDGAVVYVGRCLSARERWGQQGYGLISPRNCYDGGQPTNCKVNHLILEAAKASRVIELWFRQTETGGALEAELIRTLRPAWNSRYPV